MSTPMFNFSPRFPWSGDVIQDIDPQTSWFFGAIAPEAGVPRIERHIAQDVASYGTQLSAIFDVLHELSQDSALRGKLTARTRTKFERIRERVVAARDQGKERYAEHARESLERLKQADRKGYDELVRALKSG